MTEVGSLLKPDTYGLCGCGCGRTGRYRKKPWDDGVLCVRNCDKTVCRHCRGSRANSSGRGKQAMVRKRVGAQGRWHGAGHEENWQGPVRTEVKSGNRDAQVVATAYERERAQADQSKPIGDTRAFMASYAPKGTRRSYHVFRDDELERAVFALAEAFGYGEQVAADAVARHTKQEDTASGHRPVPPQGADVA